MTTKSVRCFLRDGSKKTTEVKADCVTLVIADGTSVELQFRRSDGEISLSVNGHQSMIGCGGCRWATKEIMSMASRLPAPPNNCWCSLPWMLSLMLLWFYPCRAFSPVTSNVLVERRREWVSTPGSNVRLKLEALDDTNFLRCSLLAKQHHARRSFWWRRA